MSSPRLKTIIVAVVIVSAFVTYSTSLRGVFPEIDDSIAISPNDNRPIKSPLNDKSIPWDASIKRLWLKVDLNDRPEALITITSTGWNHPNQTFGLTEFRTKRSRELVQGIINHPWFHPTAWDDIIARRWEPPEGTRVYVFMDTETCGEKNWPSYGKGLEHNGDDVLNRTLDWRKFHPNAPLKQIMGTDLMKDNPDVKLIVFDCGGFGPEYRCLDRGKQNSPKISLASISASPWHHLPVDQGFPPPVVKEVPLNETNLLDIQTCNEASRPFLLTFAGNFRSQTRKNFRDWIHNGDDILAASGKIMRQRNLDYETLLVRSKFGAAPRGDNLFSYRFSEIMSSGAIPVVYADDWVLPFESIINWTEISVTIREKDMNQTRAILSNIGDRERCRMREKMLQVYDKYVRRASGTIDGIIESLEAKAKIIQGMNEVELKQYYSHETQVIQEPPT